MRYTNYTENKMWNALSIRRMCVDNNYYTYGDNEEYDKMLEFIRNNRPTKRNILWVANNIFEHSDIEGIRKKYNSTEDEVFENILFNIGDVIYITYTVR